MPPHATFGRDEHTAMVITVILLPPVIATLKRILPHSLRNEPAPVVPHKTVDTVTDLTNYRMKCAAPGTPFSPSRLP